jgi:hypothetical protein
LCIALEVDQSVVEEELVAISCFPNLKGIAFNEVLIRICCSIAVGLFGICEEVLVASLQQVEQWSSQN